MKRFVIYTISLLIGQSAFAQQKPHYTQYVLNQYIINPALAGIENYVDIKMSHRHQWVGLQDAPVTTYLSIQGPIGKDDSRVSATGVSPEGENPRGREYWSEYSAAPSHHGVGMQLMRDVTGPLSRTAIYGTYAFHIAVSEKTMLAAGFGAGLTRLTLDMGRLQFGQAGDPSAYQNGIINSWKPDMNAGLYLYSSNFFVGLSAQQIVPQRLEFRENSLKTEDGKMVPHIFMTAGYRMMLDDNFNLMPSVMLKSIQPFSPQVEGNLKLQYQDKVWTGISYRHEDGYAAMAGMNVSNKFNIGYSYDYTTSKLNAFTKGTHEILLGFLLNNTYGDSCPRRVW